jgi:hypothetical protein
VLSADLLDGVEIVAAGSLSSVISLARTLLVRRHTPVAIVIDADTADEEAIREKRQSTDEIVRMVAGDIPVAVIVAVPDLETVLFYDASVLKRLFNQAISQEILTLARVSSREALKELGARSKTVRDRSEIVAALTSKDAEKLRGAPPIQELVRFLEKARALSLQGSGTSAVG